MPANIFPSRDREQRRGTGHLLLIAAAIAFVCHNTTAWGADAAKPPAFFGIRVVDEQSGRGVPLVELRTVSEAAYVTDSAGWAAVAEPDLAGKDVYFHLRSPGYDIPADGFGFRGRRLKVVPGESAEIKLRRTTVAERLYRITGQGVYRDTELLGFDPPVAVPQRGKGVAGQDSVQAVRWHGGMFWIWGETKLSHYALGNFEVTAANLLQKGDENPSAEQGIDFE